MNSSQKNAAFGLIEYTAQPVAMLAAAPLLLRGLGAEQFGLWVLVMAVSATAAGLGGGFGEATARYVAKYRGRGDPARLLGCFAACFAINVALGSAICLVLLVIAPVLARHAFHIRPALLGDAVMALRLGAVIILLRAMEAVQISCLRAFERYGMVALLSAAGRFATLGAAVALVYSGFGVVAILAATAALAGVSVAAEGAIARSVAGGQLPCRAEFRSCLAEVAGFGGYGWLKSATGVAFAYADRLAVASLLGAGPLALYALANQLTQPIPATVAAATNFLFPHLSARWAAGEQNEVRRTYRTALLATFACVALLSLPLIAGSRLIVALWLGPGYARELPSLVSMVAIGNALLAATVVPHYTALALGRARSVALINIAAAVISLGAGVLLMNRAGLSGAPAIKVAAGMVSLLIFAVVRSGLAAARSGKAAPVVVAAEALGDD